MSRGNKAYKTKSHLLGRIFIGGKTKIVKNTSHSFAAARGADKYSGGLTLIRLPNPNTFMVHNFPSIFQS